MNTLPRLLTRIGIVFFILITTQCGTGCKKDDKVDKRPDITPNMLEAARPFADLYNMLLDLKAGKSVNINQVSTPSGLTPLHYTVYTGKESLVKLLLKEGADVNLELENEMGTPLQCAIISPNYSLPIIKLLLAQSNIDKEKKYKYKSYTPTPLFVAIEQAYPDVVQALLDAGANYITPIDGKKPYRYALECAVTYTDKKEERRQIVAILQAKGAPY